MRLISLALVALLLLIQYPLWLGKGGWLRVSELETQVAASHQKTADLKARNASHQPAIDRTGWFVIGDASRIRHRDLLWRLKSIDV
jgi:hypothetical protein